MIYPIFTGESIYPDGISIHPRKFFVEGECIESIFLRHRKNDAYEEDVQWLKDYVIYYINSPCFDLKELRAKNLKRMTLDELIWECLDYCADPF